MLRIISTSKPDDVSHQESQLIINKNTGQAYWDSKDVRLPFGSGSNDAPVVESCNIPLEEGEGNKSIQIQSDSNVVFKGIQVLGWDKEQNALIIPPCEHEYRPIGQITLLYYAEGKWRSGFVGIELTDPYDAFEYGLDQGTTRLLMDDNGPSKSADFEPVLITWTVMPNPNYVISENTTIQDIFVEGKIEAYDANVAEGAPTEDMIETLSLVGNYSYQLSEQQIQDLFYTIPCYTLHEQVIDSDGTLGLCVSDSAFPGLGLEAVSAYALTNASGKWEIFQVDEYSSEVAGSVGVRLPYDNCSPQNTFIIAFTSHGPEDAIGMKLKSDNLSKRVIIDGCIPFESLPCHGLSRNSLDCDRVLTLTQEQISQLGLDIFNTAGSKAIADYTLALGKDTVAGCRGYRIKSYDTDNHYIYLTTDPMDGSSDSGFIDMKLNDGAICETIQYDLKVDLQYDLPVSEIESAISNYEPDAELLIMLEDGRETSWEFGHNSVTINSSTSGYNCGLVVEIEPGVHYEFSCDVPNVSNCINWDEYPQDEYGLLALHQFDASGAFLGSVTEYPYNFTSHPNASYLVIHFYDPDHHAWSGGTLTYSNITLLQNVYNSPTRNDGYTTIDENFITPEYETDDVFSIVNGPHYDLIAKIESISHNRVKYTYDGDVDPLIKAIETIPVDDGEDRYAFLVPTKPDVGVVLLKSYAMSTGVNTMSVGIASSAEGRETLAFGDYSHAEGRSTEAGYCSHSEGMNTRAIGQYSHTEGYNTETKGKYSHSEGIGSKANGSQSHAEGETTVADGIATHSEGKNSKAKGDYSHAEGYASVSDGAGSHSEGYATNAKASYSHSEGYKANAFGEYSHAEGRETTSNLKASHAEGYKTTAGADYSHAEGRETTASGSQSHSEGLGSTASNNASHAEGYRTESNGIGSHSEGWSSIANGKSSHAEGLYTQANGEGQHVQGKYNIEDTEGKYAHIVGNGTGDSAAKRKNAHTLDWNGNAWFAGNVTVGESNDKLVTQSELQAAVNNSGGGSGSGTYIIQGGEYIGDVILTNEEFNSIAQTHDVIIINGCISISGINIVVPSHVRIYGNDGEIAQNDGIGKISISGGHWYNIDVEGFGASEYEFTRCSLESCYIRSGGGTEIYVTLNYCDVNRCQFWNGYFLSTLTLTGENTFNQCTFVNDNLVDNYDSIYGFKIKDSENTRTYFRGCYFDKNLEVLNPSKGRIWIDTSEIVKDLTVANDATNISITNNIINGNLQYVSYTVN